ncbi:MAG: DUF2752 domain-containing protein [Bacteroidota bacterium]
MTVPAQKVNRFAAKRILWAGVLLLSLAAPWLINAVSDNPYGWQSVCPVKAVTGFPCPGCGILRSWCQLTSGHFIDSFYIYPFGMAAYALFLFFSVRLLAEAFRGYSYPAFWKRIPKLAPLTAIAVCVFHIARLSLIFADGSWHTCLHQGLVYRLGAWLFA